MRLLVTGSSGFIGSKVVRYFRSRSFDVVRLLRSDASQPEPDAVFWNPIAEELDLAIFNGIDAVIHLAGKNIASGRWTRKRKLEFFLSRCRDTWLLSQALSRLKKPPEVLISASATGFYGNRGAEVLTEKSDLGEGFLADLCKHWEKGTHILRDCGVRVVNPRFGMVLSPSGGTLQKLVPWFRKGLGMQIGPGDQWLSWIGLYDVMRALEFVLLQPISGPVNFVAPHPVQQRDFATILASRYNRRLLGTIPAWAVDLCLGEMGRSLLLNSTRAVPEKLCDAQFSFLAPQWDGDVWSYLDF